MRKQLESVCRTIDAAKAAGFQLSYGTGDDATGKQIITKLDVLRKM